MRVLRSDNVFEWFSYGRRLYTNTTSFRICFIHS